MTPPGRSAAVVVLAGMLAACGGSPPAQVQQQDGELVLGEPSTADEDSVLLLRATEAGELVCTATLVAPNLVVTTRHCVAQAGPPLFQCTKDGELVPHPDGRGTLGANFSPSNIELYSGPPPRTAPIAIGKEIISTLTDTTCKNDIAFVVLDRDLDLPLRPMRLGAKTHSNESVLLVGYGARYSTELLDYRTQERRRMNEVIDYVGPDTVEQGVYDAPPRTLLIRGPASCFGDSGGPALSAETGAVVGVFSMLSSSDCGSDEIFLYYTATGPFTAFAQQAFDAAGAAPTLESTTGTLPPDAASCDNCSEPSEPGSCAFRAVEQRQGGWAGLLLVALVMSMYSLRKGRRCNRS